MTEEDNLTRISTLSDLRLLLSQEEEGLQNFVYSRLRIGDVWWIPDEFTGFGDKERHPWVVVKGYFPSRASVILSPRTTTRLKPKDGIITPAEVIPGLSQKGLFVLRHRRTINAKEFRGFDYIGRLPTEWISKIQEYNWKSIRGN